MIQNNDGQTKGGCMRLPMNSIELSRRVFKGKGLNEPVGLLDVFNVKQICHMLDNGQFESYDRDWMYNALGSEIDRLTAI